METRNFNKKLLATYDHLWKGRYRLALKEAKNLFKHFPDNGDAAICLSWALLENGYPIKALDFADLSVELKGDETKTKLLRGYILLRMNILDGAETDLSRSIELQTTQLIWAYLNQARSLAGKGKFKDALKKIDLAIAIDNKINLNLKKLKNLYRSAKEIVDKNVVIIPSNAYDYLKKANHSIQIKEYWYSLLITEKILSDKDLRGYHNEAILIKLEAMFQLFQFNPALDLAQKIKKKFKKSERFNKLYNELSKSKDVQEQISVELDKEFESVETDESHDKLISTHFDRYKTLHGEDEIDEDKKKMNTAFYPNDNVEVFSAKTYNQLDEKRTGTPKFCDQFNIDKIEIVDLEIIFSNPLFRMDDIDYQCQAVWYLNDYEIERNDFVLKVKKDWDSVVFNQSCGDDQNEDFWKIGQGRVELYVNEFKVCEKWFFIDHTSIYAKKPETIIQEDIMSEKEQTEEKQQNEFPSSVQIQQPEETKTLEELLEELDTFIGLNNIKSSIRDFISYIEFQKEREKHGFKKGKEFSINAVFEGNPGTGKTTIARLLGQIFRAMGMLDKGQVVEVDRSGLVGQYVGETAQKTEKVINEAKGGILFIDEAYTLVKKGGTGQDFGQEAIDILLKRMEDMKGEFVVITAGYPDEMKTFLESNPGMKSRFSYNFTFEDYTPDELMEIFKKEVANEEFNLDEKNEKELKKEFITLYRKRDKTFGNARLVKQIFEKLKIELSKRVSKLPEGKKEVDTLSTFTLEDIKTILKSRDEKVVNIPIDDEALKEALDELNNLIGLSTVKNEIRDLIKLVQYFVRQNENVKDKFADHILFLGNPGTGKTTVARIVSKIYSALGILPKGHLIEVDRTGLVGTHVGETAQKTTQVIDKSLGGTLFIDEAYTLSKADSGNDFGKESIDTLLKRMEDDRGNFIVIAAGYTEEMQKFTSSNPGIKSRFSKSFMFEDYTPDELLNITDNSLDKLDIQMDDKARATLEKHYNEIYRNRDNHFGNARIVRNILERVGQKRLLRLADLPDSEMKKDNVNKIILKDLETSILSETVAKEYEVKGDPEKLELLMKELHSLTGLKSVKENVEKLLSSLKVGKVRKERGLKVLDKNLHTIFLGNPGTGKTTVARLLSKIYKELGLIEKGHLIEVSRSDLVAGYQGQTAIKTEQVVKSAIGGTLFIDEAYTLSRGSNDYGQEAIDTLMKMIEDHRGEFITIIAGYTNEMKMFLDSNPGIKSRFAYTFNFNDYSPRELLIITAEIAESNGYTLDEGALQVLMDLYSKQFEKRDKNFGNGRTARNILFEAISNQEDRIATLYDLNDKDLTTIIIDDVNNISLTNL